MNNISRKNTIEILIIIFLLITLLGLEVIFRGILFEGSFMFILLGHLIFIGKNNGFDGFILYAIGLLFIPFFLPVSYLLVMGIFYLLAGIIAFAKTRSLLPDVEEDN